jgi:hypothetical protein
MLQAQTMPAEMMQPHLMTMLATHLLKQNGIAEVQNCLEVHLTIPVQTTTETNTPDVANKIDGPAMCTRTEHTIVALVAVEEHEGRRGIHHARSSQGTCQWFPNSRIMQMSPKLAIRFQLTFQLTVYQLSQ